MVDPHLMEIMPCPIVLLRIVLLLQGNDQTMDYLVHYFDFHDRSLSEQELFNYSSLCLTSSQMVSNWHIAVLKNLLSYWPDLLTSLVGVFIRFQTSTVGVSGDIKNVPLSRRSTSRPADAAFRMAKTLQQPSSATHLKICAIKCLEQHPRLPFSNWGTSARSNR